MLADSTILDWNTNVQIKVIGSKITIRGILPEMRKATPGDQYVLEPKAEVSFCRIQTTLQGNVIKFIFILKKQF
jgi:hypothetical protein